MPKTSPAEVGLTFVEETCLLLLDEKTGEFLPVQPNILECALIGAVLMDLSFAYRIDTDPETLTVVDPTPTGEAMLDRVLVKLGEQVETLDTKTWIRKLVAETWIQVLATDAGTGLLGDALQRLVERGILERRQKRGILGKGKVQYFPGNGAPVHTLRERMRALIQTDEIPDPHDVALLSLLDACKMLPAILPEDEHRGAELRIKQFGRMDLVGRDVIGAVSEIERMLVAARAHGAY